MGTLGTPCINNVGMGNGGQGGGGGDDGYGDISNGSGKGQNGKGFGYGNKRFEFTLVKSSNITIIIFSGSNLNNQPYLPFYKSIKRLIYNQGDDGELLLDDVSRGLLFFPREGVGRARVRDGLV